MGYLITKLVWYVVLAFVIGLIVGWITCAEARDDRS